MVKKKKPSPLLKLLAKPQSKPAKLQLTLAKLLKKLPKKQLPLLTKLLLLPAKLPLLLAKLPMPLAKLPMLLLLLLPPSNYGSRNNQPAFGPVFFRLNESASEKSVEPCDSFGKPWQRLRVGKAKKTLGPMLTKIQAGGDRDPDFLQQRLREHVAVVGMGAAVGVEIERALGLRRDIKPAFAQRGQQKIPTVT